MENKAQKNILNTLYGFLVLSTVLGFMPNGTAFTASAVLWLVTLIAAYFYRSRDHEDGLLYNHMTYLIGTIWIGTSFIVIGALLAGAWVYYSGDNSAIHSFMNNIQSGAMPDEAMLEAVKNDYISANTQLLWTASIIAIGPAILYLVYRVANGMSRAAKGYRIANPKSWL